MPIISDFAVVLRRLDYSETSQILVLFTREHGKVRAIAKGVKRSTKTRFAPGVDLLDVGQAVVSVRSETHDALATLTEWKQGRPLGGLREKLVRLSAAMYVGEITAQLTEDFDPHPGVYDALVEALTALSQADVVHDAVVGFQRTLLIAAGSFPVFEACVACGKAGDLSHFSALQGGMLCGRCAARQHERRPVLPATLAALRGRGEGPMPEGAFALLNYHIAHLIGREPLLGQSLLSPQRRKSRGHGREGTKRKS